MQVTEAINPAASTHYINSGAWDERPRSVSRSSPDPPRSNKTPATLSVNSGARDKCPRSLSQSSPDPPPKRTKSKVKEAQFREGFVQQSGAKPAAGDYEPVVEALLIQACNEYSAHVAGAGSFPKTSLQLQWADQCFNNACRSSNERFKLSHRMAKLITKRDSQVRGKVVDTAFRPLFITAYGFQRSTSKKAIAENKKKAEALLRKAAFHYKDPLTCTGYGENAIITEARKLYLFKDKTSLAAVFPSYFNPISAELMALEFTVLQFLAQEWTAGIQIKIQFTEKENGAAYQTHLHDITEKWMKLKPDVTEKLRSKCKYFAAVDAEKTSNIDDDDESMLRLELEGRTGDTDSEPEDGDAAEADTA
ncbi:hypothetical protein GGX14DRAFT_577203 [Mycena pura]|uniref:DUF6532 domain-containing protein n=1 Tax=Mycena pura TaxID=153505 RepID=A0AAD6UTP1_9AGAR|nr:hypothetical protein GGX14DRAFT_577203 [Mycena pura]